MTATDARETVFIVDYDLPQGSIRRRFYRHVQAYLVDHEVTGVTDWSTQSVVVTTNREIADFIYVEASQLGQAHIYEAKRIR